jgi:hypothetical protein
MWGMSAIELELVAAPPSLLPGRVTLRAAGLAEGVFALDRAPAGRVAPGELAGGVAGPLSLDRELMMEGVPALGALGARLALGGAVEPVVGPAGGAERVAHILRGARRRTGQRPARLRSWWRARRRAAISSRWARYHTRLGLTYSVTLSLPGGGLRRKEAHALTGCMATDPGARVEPDDVAPCHQGMEGRELLAGASAA